MADQTAREAAIEWQRRCLEALGGDVRARGAAVDAFVAGAAWEQQRFTRSLLESMLLHGEGLYRVTPAGWERLDPAKVELKP